MNVGGATVLLTGATGGIGQAVARELHANGAKLVLTGRRTDVLAPLAAELGQSAAPSGSGRDVRTLTADLADRAAVARLLDEAGDVDVLVANAALPASGPVTSFSVEELDRALDVNLRAPMMLSRELAPRLVERGRGAFVFISSLSGKAATGGASVYAATKYGLRGFALGLRADLHGTGVNVTTIFPGFIRDAGMFAETGVKLRRGVGTKSPQDVARAVVRAIERGPAEVDVAPLGLRLGTTFASIAPAVSETVARKLGSDRIAADIADAQATKR